MREELEATNTELAELEARIEALGDQRRLSRFLFETGYAHVFGARQDIGRPLLDRLFARDRILYVERQYQRRDVWAVTIAALTPIPYKVFAIGAGAFRLNFRRFMLASAVGRAGRFFLVGFLITIFGTQVEAAIDEYFDVLAIAFVVLLILGFVVIRFVMRPRATAADASSD